MCHKTAVQNAQIDRFVENGMPQKIVKTVKYTLKKRAAAFAAAEARLRDELEAVAAEQQITTSTTPDNAKAPRINETPTLTETTTVTADHAVSEGVIVVDEQQQQQKQMHVNERPASQLQSHGIAAKRFSPLDEATTQAAVAAEKQEVAMPEKPKENLLKIPKLCGRFRKLQQQQQQQQEQQNEQQQQHPGGEGHMDALAKGTQLTRRFTQRVGMAVEALQSSHIYTLLTKTTQPAHVIVICILAFVLLTVWPNIMDGTQQQHGGATNAAASSATMKSSTTADFGNGSQSRKHPVAVIAYLGAFATHFGAQIWMTFVSGLSLYFSLPRHMFGQCQQILFPKYFALNASLSISMLIVYVKYLLTTWSLATCIQLCAVAVCAVVEVTVRLYLAPPMLRLMHEKYKIEGAIGSGHEVGSIVQGDLVQCPHYQRVHKSFRRIHMTIAVGNMIVLVATCLHLYFIAAKIQIS